ncbi:DNA mismatch repair protein MutL [subsurface metagenome]
MGKIKRMSAALADQIAAGEVVERPASVVKELIENAIDAGATDIAVVVQQGGRSLIQVTDNGSGMDREDLALAFERHATSKIESTDDLARIATLGFRGEALPSIGSVAQVRARTSANLNEGSEITVEGGKSKGVKPAPAVGGTTIQVKNLFYSTPARRKFLKRPATENQHIVEVVRRFALCYPEVAFSLTSGGRETYRLPPADLRQRIGAVFDRFYQQSLKEVVLEKPPFKVEGYVGNLNLVRGRPGEQYIFLNRRAVQDRLLNSAVYSAYRSLISRGEYPFFVLNITMPVEMVDVNVHPAKTEVRFRDEWRVYHIVKTAVTEAIRDIPGMIPDFVSPTEGEQPRTFPTPAPAGLQHRAPTAVEKDVLFPGAAAHQVQVPHVAFHLKRGLFEDYPFQGLLVEAIKDGSGALPEVRRRQAVYLAAPAGEAESNLGIAQGEPAYHLNDMLVLSSRPLEEFPAGRCIVEQVLHLDGGAPHRRGRFHPLSLAPLPS